MNAGVAELFILHRSPFLSMMRRRFNFWRGRERSPARAKTDRRPQRIFWLLTLLFWLLMWAVLVVHGPASANLRAGFPSPVAVEARREVRYTSTIRTEEARARAESAPDTVVYQYDLGILTTQRIQLTDLLQTIVQIRDDPSLSEAEQQQKLAQLPNSTLVITESTATAIVALPDAGWASTRQLTVDLYDRAMREKNLELTEQDVRDLRERTLPYWASQGATGTDARLAVVFVSPFLKANQLVNEDKTRDSKAAARDAVAPISVLVLEGESIVREGDLITPEIEEKLQALGEVEGDTDLLGYLGRGIIAGLPVALMSVFLMASRRTIWLSLRRTLVIYSLTLITLVLARLVIGLPLDESWPYAFPLAATVLLLAALFDSGVALLVGVCLSALIAFVDGSQFNLAVALLLSTFAGVFALGRGERSRRFMAAGMAIMAVVALVQLAFWLMVAVGPSTGRLLPILLMSAVNGALSAILGLGLYNLIGQLAGIVTPFQLMELSNPSQPLLRKLIREAPGTYYHSVSVGNLAESAAEAIGADALLLRVAAYYHDVGKSARPYFYTDNQSDRENVHNDLDPLTSAQIIADHVREGVNMARSAHLPQQITDFIPTHHGTSVIQHFYQMALREADSVDVADYRYPGPKPQTKEQAILMLADSVEATVRSKSQNGKLTTARQKANGNGANGAQTLEELVASIVDERVRSGQLDESALTLQDLARIREAFVTTLQGIYHPRTEYAPQLVKV